MELFIFNQWNNPTDFERNELVFEKRNKAYGAYAIRTNYNRTFIRAFGITIFIFFSLLIIPKISQLFAKETIPTLYTVTEFVFTDPKDMEKKKEIEKHNKNNVKSKAAEIMQLSDTVLNIDTAVLKNDSVKVGTINNIDGTDSLDLVIYDGGSDSVDKIVPIGVEKENNQPRIIASTMPKFVGGNEALFVYLRENLQFPNDAQSAGISGKVSVNFVVEKDGTISNIKILACTEKGVGFEKEAMRVISSMPRWEPGIQDGHPVRVFFNIPIFFTLM